MNHYKDFDYVRYILSLDFTSGFKLYSKALERIKDDSYNKLWDLFLIDRLMGYKGNFNEYKTLNEIKSENKTMSYENRVKKEQDIFNKINQIDDSRFKKVAI